MRYILVVLFAASLLFSNQVEVVSKTFVADEKSGIAIFSGNVVITRGDDIIKGDLITVYSTPEREAYRFEVNGSAFFDVVADSNRTFKGYGSQLLYLPKDGVYTIKGSAVVEDITQNHKVSGEVIKLNEFTKSTEVIGEESRPVKIIYTIKDKNESINR